MLTKAIIFGKKQGTNLYIVRIPYFESAGSDKAYFDATLSQTPGVYESYKEGDVVFVGFEDHQIDLPVILGKLHILGDSNESRGYANFESLNAEKSASINSLSLDGFEMQNVATALDTINSNIAQNAHNNSSLSMSNIRVTSLSNPSNDEDFSGEKEVIEHKSIDGDEITHGQGDFWLYTFTIEKEAIQNTIEVGFYGIEDQSTGEVQINNISESRDNLEVDVELTNSTGSWEHGYYYIEYDVPSIQPDEKVRYLNVLIEDKVEDGDELTLCALRKVKESKNRERTRYKYVVLKSISLSKSNNPQIVSIPISTKEPCLYKPNFGKGLKNKLTSDRVVRLRRKLYNENNKCIGAIYSNIEEITFTYSKTYKKLSMH